MPRASAAKISLLSLAWLAIGLVGLFLLTRWYGARLLDGMLWGAVVGGLAGLAWGYYKFGFASERLGRYVASGTLTGTCVGCGLVLVVGVLSFLFIAAVGLAALLVVAAGLYRVWQRR